jgi:hypothetical protein
MVWSLHSGSASHASFLVKLEAGSAFCDLAALVERYNEENFMND